MKLQNNTILSSMLVLVALFLIAKLLYALLKSDRQEPLLPDTGVVDQREEPTKEEILEAMSKPAATPPPTEEQKREILEAMSKPATTPPPTEEQQREIFCGVLRGLFHSLFERLGKISPVRQARK